MATMDSHALPALAIYRKHRWLDDRRDWSATMARLWTTANGSGLLKECFRGKRALHSARLHGTLYRARDPVPLPGATRDRSWTNSANISAESDRRAGINANFLVCTGCIHAHRIRGS